MRRFKIISTFYHVTGWTQWAWWMMFSYVWFAPQACGQPDWLTQPPLPSVPFAEGSDWSTQDGAAPDLPQAVEGPNEEKLPAPEGALLEPPPPLEPEMPPSVFDAPEAPATGPVGPIWYYPWTWIPLDGWKNSAELGINGSAGNTELFSFEVGARFKRKTDLNLFDLRISHNRTTAEGVETQNNAFLFVDYERFLGRSRWTYFVKNGLAYDEFRAFDLRYNVNSGVGYAFANSEDLTLTARFGAGTSREFGGPDDRWVPEALFGLDYEHQVNQRNKFIVRTDYFPEWGDFSNFRWITDSAWEHLLDEEGNLSLKLGALNRYDSTPNGVKPNDINYSALLLYKF